MPDSKSLFFQTRYPGAMPRTEVFLTKPLPPSGIMLLLLCFFAFLHCWLNLFGELLRFADRMFYKVRAVCGVRTAISTAGYFPGSLCSVP